MCKCGKWAAMNSRIIVAPYSTKIQLLEDDRYQSYKFFKWYATKTMQLELIKSMQLKSFPLSDCAALGADLAALAEVGATGFDWEILAIICKEVWVGLAEKEQQSYALY